MRKAPSTKPQKARKASKRTKPQTAKETDLAAKQARQDARKAAREALQNAKKEAQAARTAAKAEKQALQAKRQAERLKQQAARVRKLAAQAERRLALAAIREANAKKKAELKQHRLSDEEMQKRFAEAGFTKDEVREAARILKTKGTKKRERRQAAGVMGLIGGSIGGQNRARNLTPEQRTEIARRGGLKRQALAREERAKQSVTLNEASPAPEAKTF